MSFNFRNCWSKKYGWDRERWRKGQELIKVGHPKHMQAATKSKDPDFRCCVATYGSDNDRAKLLNDPHRLVREEVAKNTTNLEHLQHLMNDENDEVSGAAYNRWHDLNEGT
jgi:hypothetical protein